ncbi:hypothetical protein SD80_004235 [Scytonema tolypothrichoides VB-61278]|nr:hypothetical protein SD80_004235 [Scytonema tolypothrichoides VB-61278]
MKKLSPLAGEFKIRLRKFALSGNQRQIPSEGDPHQVLAPPGTPVRSSRETRPRDWLNFPQNDKNPLEF